MDGIDFAHVLFKFVFDLASLHTTLSRDVFCLSHLCMHKYFFFSLSLSLSFRSESSHYWLRRS